MSESVLESFMISPPNCVENKVLKMKNCLSMLLLLCGNISFLQNCLFFRKLQFYLKFLEKHFKNFFDDYFFHSVKPKKISSGQQEPLFFVKILRSYQYERNLRGIAVSGFLAVCRLTASHTLEFYQHWYDIFIV
jgi:hypothetical protein